VRLEGRLDTPFYSWQVCRLVRRDFNFVAVKLFHREKRHGGREQVRSLAHEVRLQAELLADECTGFGAPPPGDGKLVPIRLVSPIAAGLYRSFLIADAAYAKLNHAVSAGKIQLNQL